MQLADLCFLVHRLSHRGNESEGARSSPAMEHRTGSLPAPRSPPGSLPCPSPARRTGALLASAPPDRGRRERGGEGWYLRAPPSPGGQRLKETEVPGLGFPTLSLCSRGDTEGSEGDKKGCRAAPGKARCWPRAPPAASSGRPQPAGDQPSPPPAPHREQRDTPSFLPPHAPDPY